METIRWIGTITVMLILTGTFIAIGWKVLKDHFNYVLAGIVIVMGWLLIQYVAIPFFSMVGVGIGIVIILLIILILK
ncbi:hypothetical protein DN594_06910 [Enterobacter cloacae]|jgi:hypothetical protein|uniref:hypothetical protein n=1 Tax=Enterobacter TaxID=547 RepID=UPI000F823BF9|nr:MULTISPECIES: hypothetical protein [Enterobacter]RWS61281.1 hypothetical protein DN594_06910 [Enterobacter cloacae]MBW9385037.1 hypothetical protein [Enterobacter sp. EC_64]MBW9393671.1 hypothetical protein [Enterobacter roggenkampii]MCB7498468.1 hypothetical protein [Enterobacter roggenkampii]RTM94278.1 hypothetical protein EKO00_06840 [Enterobacter roggenkampii]